MTVEAERAALVADEFVKRCADVAREKFDVKAVGARMLTHGWSLMTGLSPDEASRAVQAMLALYEQHYVNVPQTGKSQ